MKEKGTNKLTQYERKFVNELKVDIVTFHILYNRNFII